MTQSTASTSKALVTPIEAMAIRAIRPGNVTYIPGIGTKRFACQIQGAMELTAKQRIYLWAIVWKFRRQISDKQLVAIAECNLRGQRGIDGQA